MNDIPVKIGMKLLGKFFEKADQTVDNVIDAAGNAARDCFESAITGRCDLNYWADLAGNAADELRRKIEDDAPYLTFVGGKINFSMSRSNSEKVVISIELYYIDNKKHWKKTCAESDMFASNYTFEALDEIRSNGVISYEVV